LSGVRSVLDRNDLYKLSRDAVGLFKNNCLEPLLVERRTLVARDFGAVFRIARTIWLSCRSGPTSRIHSHCTPETEAGARFITPVHHQTFRLSAVGTREPIERFRAALRNTPERIARSEIGETFVLA
jgi:hypothetical protein